MAEHSMAPRTGKQPGRHLVISITHRLNVLPTWTFARDKARFRMTPKASVTALSPTLKIGDAGGMAGQLLPASGWVGDHKLQGAVVPWRA